MDERASRAAALVLASWTSGERMAELPAAVRPASVADGFAVQEALAAHAGSAYGWKIAATSAAGQAHVRLPGRRRHYGSVIRKLDLAQPTEGNPHRAPWSRERGRHGRRALASGSDTHR